MQTIKTDILNVNRIFHIADIHIRLYKRRDEYIQVFEKIYADILSKFKIGDIIVVAGDIFHTKLELSPESIIIASSFLKQLADITDTIIIAGNHDANLNNKDRLDSIFPIVKSLNHDKLHYLRSSGLYKMSNVMFSVMSVFDVASKYKLATDINDKYTKVAIYHGAINNSKTDVGHCIKNDKMDISFFNGFDIVLLGDIHKRQCMQSHEIESIVIDDVDLEKYLNSGWYI